MGTSFLSPTDTNHLCTHTFVYMSSFFPVAICYSCIDKRYDVKKEIPERDEMIVAKYIAIFFFIFPLIYTKILLIQIPSLQINHHHSEVVQKYTIIIPIHITINPMHTNNYT